MRILFFLESLHAGGRERRAAELILYLIEQAGEYEIELVLTEEEIHYEDILNAGIKIHILKRKGIKYDPRIIFSFLRICRSFRPHLIHSWGKMATFYSIPSRIICRVPLVANLIADTLNTPGKHLKYRYLLRLNTFFSDRVLSNSKAGLETYGLNSSKSRIIYNGVRLSRFMENFDTESVRKEFGVPTRFVVIMVATFSQYKDYDLFVDTAREIQKTRNDVTFIAVGDGPDLYRIRLRIQEENARNIILAGRQSNVERIISAAHIGLLCTWSEGISNSIIEYMAMGKPVISTDITGGSRELINEGITGYCTARNPVLISGLINRLLDDPELRLSMGLKGKERIEKHFSIAHMGDQFMSLYNEVLSFSPRRRPAKFINS